MANSAVLDTRLRADLDLRRAKEINIAFSHSAEVRAHLASQLLLYDTIVIPTLDFGVVISLFHWFGEGLLREILRANAIAFIRPHGIMAYVGNGNGLGHILITPGVQHQGPWWMNAACGSITGAIELQLRHLCPSLDRSSRERLTELIASVSRSCTCSNEQFKEQVAHATYREILSIPEYHDFVAARVEGTVSLNRLPMVQPNQVRILHDRSYPISDPVTLALHLAEVHDDLLLAAQVGDADLESNNLTGRILIARASRDAVHSRLNAQFAQLLEIHDVPDISEAVRRGEVSLTEIWRLRQSATGESFREWLRLIRVNGSGLVDAYRDTMSKLPYFDRLPNKIMKFCITNAAGFVNPGLGIGASIVENFVLPKLAVEPRPAPMLERLSILIRQNQ